MTDKGSRNEEFLLWLSGLRTQPCLHEDLILGLAQWVKEPTFPQSRGIGLRCTLDPVLLWLWCRPQLQLPFERSPGTSICCRCNCKKKKKNIAVAIVLCARQHLSVSHVSFTTPQTFVNRSSGGTGLWAICQLFPNLCLAHIRASPEPRVLLLVFLKSVEALALVKRSPTR